MLFFWDNKWDSNPAKKEEKFGNNQALIWDYKKLSTLYSHKTKSDLRDGSKKVLLLFVSEYSTWVFLQEFYSIHCYI